MTRPSDEQILAFIEGTADAATRETVLNAIERSPDLAAEIRTAMAGMEAIAGLEASAELAAMEDGVSTLGPERQPSPRARRRSVPAWWLPVAAAAGMAIAVPVSLAVSDRTPSPDLSADDPATTLALGEPAPTAPSFMVTLHGRWPDAADIGRDETDRRAAEYWGWATRLAEDGLLVAAGDLRWEPGLRLAAGGDPVETNATMVAEPDFLVGMFTVRADSYEEAVAIARECPHLQYGGSISVRQVGRGFVTVPGMDDWAG